MAPSLAVAGSLPKHHDTVGEEIQLLRSGFTAVTPQFILFGDSLTQRSASTLQARLQTDYIRSTDIVNRGFSGYTAPLAYNALTQFLPKQPEFAASTPAYPKIKLCTILFGANDAVLPGEPQHVPLERYIAALKDVVTYPVFRTHATKVIFITPPPVNEHQLDQPLTRTAHNTARYSEAAKALVESVRASDPNILILDLWTVFASYAGYAPLTDATPPSSDPNLVGTLSVPENAKLHELLDDGLHFTAQGYNLWYQSLMDLIRRELPEYVPENVPFVFKDWKTIFGLPFDIE